MMSKVRQALFSSLLSLQGLNIRSKRILFPRFHSEDSTNQYYTKASRVLDIFCGAGSVGLEALSRGAYRATFVDLAPQCIQTCQSNARKLGVEHQSSFVCASATDLMSNPHGLIDDGVAFDLVTLTPPYAFNYTELVQCLLCSPLLKENSICVIEYPHNFVMPFAIGPNTSIGPEVPQVSLAVPVMYLLMLIQWIRAFRR